MKRADRGKGMAISISLDDFVDILNLWVEKGVFASNLKGSDGAGPDGLRHAEKSLLFGIIVACLIELLSFFLSGDLGAGDLIALYVIFVPLLAGFLVFLVALRASLWLLRIQIKAGAVSSLACYVFSGVVPLSVLFFSSSGQLAGAILLFKDRQQPDLGYFSAATLNLLFSGQAATGAVVRAWVFLVLEAAAPIYYLILSLPRALAEASARGRLTRLRATCGVLGATAGTVLLSRLYTGRLYWGIVGHLLR
jgi:hypothetical protein